MDVSVIIVNYNTHDFLEECLNSIIRFTKNIEYEIIVVDNNSTDRTIEKFNNYFTKTKFVFNTENRGFGAGSNLGIKNSNGKYCAFVNPDIVFTGNSLGKFYEFMEMHTDAGACGGVLTNYKGDIIYTYNKFPGYFWEFLQSMGTGSEYIIDKLNNKIRNNENLYFEVDWLIGAFMFIRKDIIDKLNGFDENFFLYYEDVDIQKRIKDSGYRIFCLKNVEIKHAEQSSVKSIEGENVYFYHMCRSKIIYMKKHFNFLKRKSITIMQITGVYMRILTLKFRDKFEGKKEQKYTQYRKMLELYFGGK